MSEEFKAVAHGAGLICSAGSTQSKLLATTASEVQIEGKFLATVMDHVPIKNIPPFGHCKIKGEPCIPVLPLPWADTVLSGISAVSAPILPFNSTLQCAEGGQIFVSDCNQASLTYGINPADLPHAEPGPTPEEHAAQEAKEAWLRRYFPEIATARYGPEESPEELESRAQAARIEENAARRAAENINKATGVYARARREAQDAYNRTKVAREEAERRVTRANSRRAIEEARKGGKRD